MEDEKKRMEDEKKKMWDEKKRMEDEEYLEDPIPRDAILIVPMEVSATPKRSDILGTAGKFVDDFIINVKKAGIFESMGVQPTKTAILEGEKGTGKTLAVQIINNEINKKLLTEIMTKHPNPTFSLFTLPYDIGRYGTPYINQGSKIMQTFFDTAYQLAKQTPIHITMDEFDTLAEGRGLSQSHKEDKKVLETLMKNLQISHDTPNVYVTMMTNLIDSCDSAAIRAGRIDKRIRFELPNYEERHKGFNYIIEKINSTAGYKVIRGSKPDLLAEMSERFSYADIIQSVNSAVTKKAEEISIIETPKVIKAGYIKQGRLEKAVEKHKQEYNLNEKRIGFC